MRVRVMYADGYSKRRIATLFSLTASAVSTQACSGSHVKNWLQEHALAHRYVVRRDPIKNHFLLRDHPSRALLGGRKIMV
jgi:hypothetical protein